MPSLPRISGADAIRTFQRLGFSIVRQRGSHVILRRDESGCVVPLHRELKVGILLVVLRQAGIPVEEFITTLRGWLT